MTDFYLSRVLKKARSECGLTQERFAKELGIGIATLKNAEAGKTTLPNSAFLSSLSRFFHENETDTLRRILYMGHGYPYVLDKGHTIDAIHNRIDLCKHLLACFTVNLRYYGGMFVVSELEEELIDCSGGRKKKIVYSCLRISHNPTNIIVPVVVVAEFANLESLLSPFYEGIAHQIRQWIVSKFNIFDRIHIEVVFVVQIELKETKDDPHMRSIFELFTEKPNKTEISFVFCDSSPNKFIHRYYKRNYSYL